MTDPAATALPVDPDAILIGRVWDPVAGGPSVVTVRGRDVVDLSSTYPFLRDLTESATPSRDLAAADGPVLTSIGDLLANAAVATRDPARPWPLSPIDLQVVKAAGVTFPVSMIERVIEEAARGDADAAGEVRSRILSALGGELRDLVPGSRAAAKVKDALIAEGVWSQYLEVGIGPDAEVFSKAPVLATVGTGADVGIRGDSEWNNPEPEVVLVVSSRGVIVGATLGNDVNLRDIEGRSALLLGQAKDNNASASVGPFIRLFDGGFGLPELRQEVVTLRVDGPDGFVMVGTSPLAWISRDPADLVAQALAHHQYPDGFVLYLGTMFAPTDDRGAPGRGFTHVIGDVVSISSPRLGSLVNRVGLSETLPPWTFGIHALVDNLARRGLLPGGPR